MSRYVARWAPLVALAALASLIAFASGGPIVAAEGTLALAGHDPVRLVEGEAVAGSEDLETTHEGYRYRFATAATRDRFAADPERYSIQNDSCPVVPSAPADPSIYAVHRGRIYTFATDGCRESFVAAPGQYVGDEEERSAGTLAAARATANATSGTRRGVAILVYDGVELLDFAGPGEVFAASRGRFDVFTVGLSEAPITSQGFVEVTPRYTVANAPRAAILLLPGGAIGRVTADAAAMGWIRAAAADAEQVLSVCNGALILAEAGLLDGLEATTHQGSLAALRQRATRTTVHGDRRFVDNGKVVTAAGVSAGIDMSLHVVAKLLGQEAARATARYMEYPWEGGQA